MIYQFNSLFQSDFCFLYDESHKRPNMGVTGIASMIKVVLHEHTHTIILLHLRNISWQLDKSSHLHYYV
jgi:hypothetical protein